MEALLLHISLSWMRGITHRFYSLAVKLFRRLKSLILWGTVSQSLSLSIPDSLFPLPSCKSFSEYPSHRRHERERQWPMWWTRIEGSVRSFKWPCPNESLLTWTMPSVTCHPCFLRVLLVKPVESQACFSYWGIASAVPRDPCDGRLLCQTLPPASVSLFSGCLLPLLSRFCLKSTSQLYPRGIPKGPVHHFLFIN